MAMRSAEGNDEEGLPVLHRRTAGHEDLADLAVGGRADLSDVTQRLDAAEQVAARHRVARGPLARDAEDADGRRMHALRFLDGCFVRHHRWSARAGALPMPGHRDRKPIRLDLDRDGAEALRELDAKKVVDKPEERIV